jgi:hypothetical protein
MLTMILHKPEANYAVARVQALIGTSQEALKYLEKFLALGYSLRDGLDKVFDALKRNPGFHRVRVRSGFHHNLKAAVLSTL